MILIDIYVIHLDLKFQKNNKNIIKACGYL